MAHSHEQSPSQKLNMEVATTGAPLFLMYEQIWNHRQVGDLVVPFLVLMHQIVRASVPLMAAGASRAGARAADDPLCAKLSDYLQLHVEEEAHHDTWLMEDLETAGMTPDQLWSIAPSTSVAAMSGAQYYWIHHHHPVAILGYIRLLEGNPPSMAHIERLQDASGLPASVFRTYRLHGELDPGHLREFDEMLDGLPLSARDLQLICTSATFTAHMLANCLGEILTTAERAA